MSGRHDSQTSQEQNRFCLVRIHALKLWLHCAFLMRTLASSCQKVSQGQIMSKLFFLDNPTKKVINMANSAPSQHANLQIASV